MKLFKADTFNRAICLSYSQKLIAKILQLTGISEADANNQRQVSQQAELADVKFKYNAVFNSNDTCCIIMDKHLNVVDFNYASFRLIKTVFNERIAQGQYIGKFLSEERSDIVLDNCMRALRGDTFVVERKVTFDTGEIGWWQAEYSPAYNDSQHIAGIVFSAIDITDRKNREAKIEAQNKKLKAIALMHSHDIRSPLCTLMGLMELLKTEGTENGQRLIPMIDETITLLDNKIRQIVDLAGEE
jgi:PAS domain S-box-containing protein